MHNVNLERWRGRRDATELEPEMMQFTQRAAVRGCRGCVFNGQWSTVCKRAGVVAVRAGLRDCEDDVIYVASKIDVRQLTFSERI
jgi:hypothetical protein